MLTELTWQGIAPHKWISCIPRPTATYWTVILYYAVTIQSASTGARICALLVYTCFILRTFRAYYTFWSATRWTA